MKASLIYLMVMCFTASFIFHHVYYATWNEKYFFAGIGFAIAGFIALLAYELKYKA